MKLAKSDLRGHHCIVAGVIGKFKSN